MKSPGKSADSQDKPAAQIALYKTWQNFRNSLPVITGVLLLISLLFTLVPPAEFAKLFSGNRLLDPLIGATLGSVSAGNPLTSYIIGGELLRQGISLLAVTAFIVSWVTVGFIQLPAEALILGRRYAIIRNSVAFITSVLVAILTVLLVG